MPLEDTPGLAPTVIARVGFLMEALYRSRDSRCQELSQVFGMALDLNRDKDSCHALHEAAQEIFNYVEAKHHDLYVALQTIHPNLDN